MPKANLMKFLNSVLFIVFFIQGITALVMLFELKIVNSQQLLMIHKYNGLLLIVWGLMHVASNWSWVKAAYFRKQ